MIDFIKLYNPANSAALTPQEIQAMQSLTHDQIKQLAKAYPNTSNPRAYLMIVDSKKPAEKQLPQLSTFENLYNLITKNGMKSFVPFGFRGGIKQKTSMSKVRVRRSEVLDLSDAELKTLPGFRTKDTVQPAQEMVVTRVKSKDIAPTVTSNPETTNS